ncbi:hypothetical protein BDR22DRAFT_34083 [Usnea florida]
MVGGDDGVGAYSSKLEVKRNITKSNSLALNKPLPFLDTAPKGLFIPPPLLRCLYFFKKSAVHRSETRTLRYMIKFPSHPILENGRRSSRDICTSFFLNPLSLLFLSISNSTWRHALRSLTVSKAAPGGKGRGKTEGKRKKGKGKGKGMVVMGFSEGGGGVYYFWGRKAMNELLRLSIFL